MANDSITKSLLNAFQTVVDKTIDQLQVDRTIAATITTCLSIGETENKYMFSYNGGFSYAYSPDTYEKGSLVYILVPEGDFTNKKIIIGQVSETNDEDIKKEWLNISTYLSDYKLIGNSPLTEKEYINNDGQKNSVYRGSNGLALHSMYLRDYRCLYMHDNGNIKVGNDYDTYDYPVLNLDIESFNNSIKNASALLISADIYNNLSDDAMEIGGGNYGIIVNVCYNTNDEDNPERFISYILDSSKMTGDPYSYFSWNKQYGIYPIDSKNFKYIDSITVFSEGFVLKNENDAPEDIYFKNIELYGLEELTSYSGDYLMKVSTPDGNTLNSADSSEEIYIKANIKYQKSMDITDKCYFWWGIKDNSITSSNPDYSAKLGAGYKTLIKNSETANILTIKGSDAAAYENEYKCVAVYKNDIILVDTVKIYNNVNFYNINIEATPGKIFQLNEGNVTLTCNVEKEGVDLTKENITFIWSKDEIQLNETYEDVSYAKYVATKEIQENEDNKTNDGMTAIQALSYYNQKLDRLQYVSYPNGTSGNQLVYDIAGISNSADFSCTVYLNNSMIGTAKITISNSEEIVNNNYYIEIENGSQVFQYTESGVSPASDAVQNPIEILNLSAKLFNPDGIEVKPSSIKWEYPTEQTLIVAPSANTYKDSVSGKHLYNGEMYPLYIATNYNASYWNNQIVAIVEYNGETFKEATTLYFGKIGENGTNGTDTVVSIVPAADMTGHEDEVLTLTVPFNTSNPNLCYWNTNDKLSSSKNILKANLYTNNQLNSGYTTKWTPAGYNDVSSKYSTFSGISFDNTTFFKYKYDDTNHVNKDDVRIARAEINYNSKKYYGYYPISTIHYHVSQNEVDTKYKIKIKILKDGTMQNVLYDSNGSNPSYVQTQGVNLDIEIKDDKNYTIDWYAKGGKNDEQPNISLAKLPNQSIGSLSILNENQITSDESKYIVSKEDEISDLINGLHDIKMKESVQLIKNKIDLILLNEAYTVKEKIDLLNVEIEELEKINTNDSVSNIDILFIVENYKDILSKIKNQIEENKKINSIYVERHNEIQRLFENSWMNILTIGEENSIINSQEEYNKIVAGIYDTINGPLKEENNTLISFTLNDVDNLFNKMINRILYTELVEESEDEYYNSLELILNKYGLLNFYDEIFKTYSKQALEDFSNSILSNFNTVSDINMAYQDLYNGIVAKVRDIKLYQVEETSTILEAYIDYVANGQISDMLTRVYVVPDKQGYNGAYCNNRVEAQIKNDNELVATITVPINLMLNQYELSSINGWDGNRLEINENDGYILSPQIGAGIKNSTTNTFTGMVMGSTTNTKDGLYSDEKIGLIGYKDGKQSIFLDAKTGSATFGLPEEDDKYNEGRIELIPGGTSKIANWKIGSRTLYNIVGGDVERRKDADSRNSSNMSKTLIPHEDYGIILSAEQPYIHVKGKNFEDDESGINYIDEKNTVNPGDGLEVRIDPNNHSLFSIIQHTSGLGQKTLNEIKFGYTIGDNTDIHDLSDTIITSSENDFNKYNFLSYYLMKDSEGNYIEYRQKTTDNIGSNISITTELNPELEFPTNITMFDNTSKFEENIDIPTDDEYFYGNEDDGLYRYDKINNIESGNYIYKSRSCTYIKKYDKAIDLVSNLRTNSDTEIGFDIKLTIPLDKYSFNDNDVIYFEVIDNNNSIVGKSIDYIVSDLNEFITFYKDNVETVFKVGYEYKIVMHIKYTYTITQQKVVSALKDSGN